MLTDFQNFCTVGKPMKFATKLIWHYPPQLRRVATLRWKIKNSNFPQIFSRYGKNAKKSCFKCTDFNLFSRVTVHAVCCVLKELNQKLSAFHASSAVRVCQLMCTAPLKPLQTQVLKILVRIELCLQA